MNINPGNTVREVVVAMPAATGLFDRLGIDYCCGGQRTLADACTAAKVSVEETLRLLTETETHSAATTKAHDWRNEPLVSLITHILETHHQFTRQELERLTPMFDKVCKVHGQNHPELIQLREQFTGLKDELTTHLLKEEQVLFPFVIRLEQAAGKGEAVPLPFFRTVRNPVKMMGQEHDHAGEILRAMRTTSNDYQLPAEACFSYRALFEGLQTLEADLHQHIHLENNLLFPRAIEMESVAQPDWQNQTTENTTHHCFSQ